MIPEIPLAAVPAVTVDQMREVDRIMVEDLLIELVQMMENAGRNLAQLAIERFHPASVVVLCGPGGNGGGGLVAARHLANRGVLSSVALSNPDRLAPVPAHQLEIVEHMGVPVLPEPEPADLVIDALIGYSLMGDPHERTADLIGWANEADAPVLALDTPSGLDVTTGRPATPCVTATATMTLATPKIGLLDPTQVGELYLADISVPPAIYERLGLSHPDAFSADAFRARPLVQLVP